MGDVDTASGEPRAFLTWLFFDREFNLVEEASGVIHANEPDVLGEAGMMNVEAPTEGFMYIYVSNESPVTVMFDNLRIRYNPGRLLQVTHYYPYGLPIRELSSMYSSTRSDNNYLMTTKEWNRELGLNEYDFGARSYDPATIRWYVMDPAEQFHNPYFAIGGNPVVGVDPDGRFAFVPILIAAAIGSTISGIQAAENGQGFGSGFWKGALIAGVGAATGGVIGSGFIGGAITGGLANGISGNNILAGMASGSISGGIGGWVGGGIGGGLGNFVGGSVGSGLNATLSGAKSNEILSSALIGGTSALAMYHATTYYNWQFNGGKNLGGMNLSYKQYATMQADFTRSRFWKEEFGGALMEDGSVERFPKETRADYAINDAKVPAGAKAVYHTHWDKPGQIRYVDNNWNSVDIYDPSNIGRTVKKFTTAQYHGAYDYSKWNSFVINRYDMSFSIGGTTNYTPINGPMIRFIYSFMNY